MSIRRIYVNFVISHIRLTIIEQRSCVWNVGYLKNEHRLDRLQRIWTREIESLKRLHYVSRLKIFGIYSKKGRMLRIYLIQIWMAFHSDIDVGLSDMFEYARNIRTRAHAIKPSIPLCRKDVKMSSIVVRCVNIWNSILAEAVASNNLGTFKAELDRFLGERLYEISQYNRKNSSSNSFKETQPAM